MLYRTYFLNTRKVITYSKELPTQCLRFQTLSDGELRMSMISESRRDQSEYSDIRVLSDLNEYRKRSNWVCRYLSEYGEIRSSVDASWGVLKEFDFQIWYSQGKRGLMILLDFWGFKQDVSGISS